ncbi:MAG: hypothetical protein LW823_09085 [Rickettsiales bacterium]|jgi:hypothetical protein|nr:hypothetical protein [Rickettsiales bacterium]
MSAINELIVAAGVMILSLLLMVSPVLVYLDAIKHRIGKIPADKSLFNMKAGGWAAGVLIFAILFLPAYLIKRGALISKARISPVEVSKEQKIKSLVIIIFFSLLLTFFSYMRG